MLLRYSNNRLFIFDRFLLVLVPETIAAATSCI